MPYQRYDPNSAVERASNPLQTGNNNAGASGFDATAYLEAWQRRDKEIEAAHSRGNWGNWTKPLEEETEGNDWTGGSGNPINVQKPEETYEEQEPVAAPQVKKPKTEQTEELAPAATVSNVFSETNQEEETPVQTVTPVVPTNDRSANDAFSAKVDSVQRDEETEFYKGNPSIESIPENPFPRRGANAPSVNNNLKRLPVVLPQTQTQNPVQAQAETPAQTQTAGDMTIPVQTGGRTAASLESQWFNPDGSVKTQTNPLTGGDAFAAIDAIRASRDNGTPITPNPSGYVMDEYGVEIPAEDVLEAQQINNERLQTVQENTPEQYQQGYEYDLPAKFGMWLNNTIYGGLDDLDTIGAREQFVADNMKDMAFGSEQERVETEQRLNEEFDRMLADGTLGFTPRRKITSNEVRAGIDAMNAADADRLEYLKEKRDRNLDQTNALIAEAEQAAEDAGYLKGTNEFDTFVYNYRKDNPNPVNSGATVSESVNRPSQTDIANYIYNLRSNPFLAEVDRGMSGVDFNTRNALLNYANQEYENRVAQEIYNQKATENVYADLTTMDAPGYNGDKSPNDALNTIMESVDFYDDNGNKLYQNEDGTFSEGVVDANGNVTYRPYTGDVHRQSRYKPDDIFNLYVNQNYGQPGHEGEYLYRGLEWLDDLKPEEREGVLAILNDGLYGGSGIRDFERNKIHRREVSDLTEDEYNYFADLFLDHMPALQDLMRAGLLDRYDENGNPIVTGIDAIKDFFFKAYKGEVGNRRSSGSSGGYGYGYPYRGYGGGGGGGYYYGGGGGWHTSGGSTGTRQNDNRVYNIMKNWSF